MQPSSSYIAHSQGAPHQPMRPLGGPMPPYGAPVMSMRGEMPPSSQRSRQYDIPQQQYHMPEDLPGPPGKPPQTKAPRHLFKTALCSHFTSSGSCPWGLKCSFAHGVGELRQVPQHHRYKQQVCRSFLAGYCPYGPDCTFLHPGEDVVIPVANGEQKVMSRAAAERGGYAPRLASGALPSHPQYHGHGGSPPSQYPPTSHHYYGGSGSGGAPPRGHHSGYSDGGGYGGGGGYEYEYDELHMRRSGNLHHGGHPSHGSHHHHSRSPSYDYPGVPGSQNSSRTNMPMYPPPSSGGRMAPHQYHRGGPRSGYHHQPPAVSSSAGCGGRIARNSGGGSIEALPSGKMFVAYKQKGDNSNPSSSGVTVTSGGRSAGVPGYSEGLEEADALIWNKQGSSTVVPISVNNQGNFSIPNHGVSMNEWTSSGGGSSSGAVSVPGAELLSFQDKLPTSSYVASDDMGASGSTTSTPSCRGHLRASMPSSVRSGGASFADDNISTQSDFGAALPRSLGSQGGAGLWGSVGAASPSLLPLSPTSHPGIVAGPVSSEVPTKLSISSLPAPSSSLGE